MLRTTTAGLMLGVSTLVVNPAAAQTELTMYYPIAVGGPLTEVVDGIVADFEAENPDVTVNAIYAGNYDDTRIKALSALNSGEPAQLAVMFSIDAYDLIEQELIVPFRGDRRRRGRQAWLDSFYPALMANGKHRRPDLGHPVPAIDHRRLLQQGHVPRGRTRPRGAAHDMG
jgi:sn-glycerol 3-phosphate transport system substrate-binding protein